MKPTKKKPVELGEGVEVTAYHAASVTLDEANLKTDFERVSRDLAYWGELHARAVKRALDAKNQVALLADDAKRRKAELWLELLAERTAAGEKTSEKALECAVEVHPDVSAMAAAARDARAELATAEGEKVRVWAVVQAIHAKREMAVSLGATVRKEMESDPSIVGGDEEEDQL